MKNYQTTLDCVQFIKFCIIECIMKNDDAELEDLILKLLWNAIPDDTEEAEA